MELISSLEKEACLIKKQSVITAIATVSTAFASEVEENDDASTRFAAALLQSGIPRSSERDEEREYERGDFVSVPETAAAALECAKLVLEAASRLRSNFNVVTLFGTLCYAHSDPSLPWSDRTSVEKSNGLLPLLHGGSPTNLATNIIKHILPNLTKDTWKKNPCYRHIYRRALLQIKLPHLSDHLHLVLPPALLLVDDYMMHNQLLGVSCLQHIIVNVSPTELQWQGRSEVMYDALKHLLYVREPKIVEEVYVCFMTFLFTADVKLCSLLTAYEEHEFQKKAEEVFYELLRGAESEQRIVLRAAYSKHLASYIECLGIRVVKYMQKTLNVILEYIEVYEGPEQTSRRNGLLALEALIKVAWPRMAYHFDKVVRTLFKLAYDLEERKIEDLNEELAKCLKVLKDACPKEFAKFVDELHGLEEKAVPGIWLLLSCST